MASQQNHCQDRSELSSSNIDEGYFFRASEPRNVSSVRLMTGAPVIPMQFAAEDGVSADNASSMQQGNEVDRATPIIRNFDLGVPIYSQNTAPLAVSDFGQGGQHHSPASGNLPLLGSFDYNPEDSACEISGLSLGNHDTTFSITDPNVFGFTQSLQTDDTTRPPELHAPSHAPPDDIPSGNSQTNTWGETFEHSPTSNTYSLPHPFATSPSPSLEPHYRNMRPGTPWTRETTRSKPGLPRRRSKYSLARSHQYDRLAAIAIPAASSEQNSEPLQRWRDSPPETEAASLSAIFNALQNAPVQNHARPAPIRRDSSSQSVDSWPSHSSSSVASTWSSRSNTLRSIQTSAGRISKARNDAARAKDKPRIFHCTFCCDTFGRKHDWARHEKALHLNCDQWICAPYGGAVVSPVTLRSHCAYCNILDPTNDHLEGHNHSACHNGQEPHVFRRKDHLIQHLRGFHQLETLPVLDEWRIQPPTIVSRCGFCDKWLESWQARADHLADHFREGKTMKDWNGDHGFEQSIASQIRNALPPYLLSNEAKTVVPFSATNPTVSDHLAQIVHEHRGPQDPSGYHKAVPEPGNRINPGFEVTPTSYTRFLAWHLGRFAQQSFSTGICPTDQMFQDEARRLVYGSNDNWEQTIADNDEWLAAFRRQHLAGE